MSSPKDRIPLRGSVRAPLPGAHAVGAANPDEPIEVTVLLRPRASKESLNIEQMAARLPQDRQHLTREKLAETRGADPQDISKIEDLADVIHLSVVGANPADMRVVLFSSLAYLSIA